MFNAYRDNLRYGFMFLMALGLMASSACTGSGGAAPGTPSAAGVAQPASGMSAAMAVTPVPTLDILPGRPSQKYVAVVVKDDPLVFYQLNERSGTVALDSSGHGHNAAYVDRVALGQTPLLTSDPHSHSASFASGYAEENILWTKQAVSAECWIRPATADISGSPRIIDNAWTDHSGNGFMVWSENGIAAFSTGWLKASNTQPLSANKTYHIVGTYDAATGATLYVNGLAMANVMPGATPNPQRGDGTTTYIGVLNATEGGYGYTDYFQGDISDCAIYDRALTPANVADHYNAGADAHVTPRPIPTIAPTPTPPPPTPTPSPLAYNAKTACIAGRVFSNTVLPTGEGEFETNGFDRSWWGRYRGNPLGGNHYSGFQTSWGRNQYDTYFGDENDGISYPSDDPFYAGADTNAPGAPHGVRISAKAMPAHLIGNPKINGADWYAGVLDTPVDQQYGFFVARLRLPSPDPGMSPAYWLLSNNGMPQGQHGPLNGEWDIQEMFGNDLGNGMNSGNIVWNSGASTPQNWGGTYAWLSSEPTTPSENYHDYGVLVSPHGAKISPNDYGPGGPGQIYGPWNAGATNYLDGVPLYAHTGGADMTQGVAWKEMMAMFQVGGQGGWLGSPNPAQFPADYWVQWIRAYAPTSTPC